MYTYMYKYMYMYTNKQWTYLCTSLPQDRRRKVWWRRLDHAPLTLLISSQHQGQLCGH